MKRLLLILFLGGLIFDLKAKSEPMIEKTKTYFLSFDAKGIKQLNISNKFGNIDVKQWDKENIDIKVTVKANAISEILTNKYLNDISIQHFTKNNIIEVFTSTKMMDTKNQANKKISYYSVNYEIKMPKHIKLNIDNEFGNINLPDLWAASELNLNYGKLKAQTLKNANVSLKFSEAEIEEMAKSSLSSTYSNINLSFVKDTEINCQKGVLEAGHLENVKGDLNFSKVNFKSIEDNILLNISYLKEFNLGNINNNLKQLEIISNFTDIEIPEFENFDGVLELNANNTKVYLSKGFSTKIIKTESKKPETKTFKAIIGKPISPKSVILIQAKNSEIKLDK